MKLAVPFYPQTNATNCGPAALQMILSYLGKQFDIDVIEREAGIEAGKGLYSIQLALAAARLGYTVTFYTHSLGFNARHFEMDFYKKYASMNEARMARAVLDAKEAGVILEERSISLEKLLSYVSLTSLVLILLDWNSILDRGEYQGHFVPVVGFDDTFVYVHNPDSREGAFFSIARDLFDRARKATGTDEDCVVIQKP